ncbi:hypothetical protein NC969_14090 [Leptolyngbya subtilissima ST-M1]|uniref:hypothetical protein n=1 Tax=Cyanophyceae TaxID=3028117 RepID=UPI001F55403A|nr:hypothetical protein [Nodosilinea sp. FACHB-131]
MFLDNMPEGSRPDTFGLPTYRQETLRHILLGDHDALIDGINHWFRWATAIASLGQNPSPLAAVANISAS